MAANMDALIRIAARVDGANTIQAFSRDLKGLDGAARLSTTDLGRMNIAINRMAREAGNTTSGIRAHIGALENLRSRVDIGSKAYNRLGNEIDQLRGKLRGVDREVGGTQSSFNQLGAAAAAAAAGMALLGAGRYVFSKTAELETQTRSLQVLTGSAEQARQIVQELQQLGAVTPFTGSELVDAAKRLQAFGVETEKVVDVTRRLADVSGATGAELQGIVTAYGQVQAKGRLQGEELLQFQERGVALQTVLRDEYKLSSAEFQKALEKGQISAAAVELALIKLTDAGGKYANGAIAQSDTLSGRLSTVQDGVDALAREVGKLLTPATLNVLEGINERLSQTPAFIDNVSLAFQYAAGQLAPFLNGLEQLGWYFTNLTPPGWAMQIIGGAAQRGGGTIEGFAARQRQAQRDAFIGPAAPQTYGPAVPERLRRQPTLPPLARPASSAGTGSGTGGGGPSASRSNLNQLLIENLRLNTELGNVGKDRISQLNAEIELIPQILKLQLSVLNASAKGQDLQQARINAITEARTRSAQLEEELEGVNKEVGSLAAQAAALRASAMSGLGPKGSPLQEEIQKVKQELLDADDAAAELLSRLSELAGTNPISGPVRGAIGNLRGDLSKADPSAIASQRLVQGDMDGLRQQVAELQNAGRQMSTLEQLAAKYGADWDQINPKLRESIGALAQQKDQLQQNVDKTREWNATLNQAGTTIGGVLSDLVTGTNDWKSSLSGALKALANMAFQSALMGLAGNDGKGVFSFLTGTLKFANGGVMTDRGELPLRTYSRGGIANSPQLALYGEGRTPEAYVPLPDGRRIPVAMQGGSSNPINVVVNVDAKGTQVEGNQTEGAELGRAISAAVQAEIIKQQRPGGRLASTRR